MWSKTKQALESRLAEGLKGRVAYNYAVYRMDGKCPTECQVLSILVDGESWFHTNQRFWIEKFKTRPEPEDNDIIRETGLVENYWGDVMEYVHQYLNVLSIEEAITHQNYFIRLLAVLDARLGKRKVRELAANVANEPEWFRKWILLRAGAAAPDSPDPADAKKPLVPLSKSMNRRPWKIVSGGQTGVDRAGLVAAMSFSIATGGWVPCGRLAEDGVVPEGFYTGPGIVAGPRESGSPGIFARAKKTLLEAFAFFRNHSGGDFSAIDDKGDLVAWMDVEFAEELLAERDIGEDMAVKWKKETLLPMQIWIDESRAYERRGPANRIAFQLDASDELKPDSMGWMDLDGNLSPESPAGDLGEGDLDQLRNFVRNNRSALEQLADTTIHLYQIWPDIIKGGNPASADEIKALADKVVALVESNRKEWEKQ